MNPYAYRLAVIFDSVNIEYSQYLQNQIDEFNKKLAEQNRKIELVELTPDNMEDRLAEGAVNGVTYFTKQLEEYQNVLETIVKESNGIDVFPINHEREKNQTQEKLANEEIEKISSINEKTNVFSAIKVNNSNEMKAFTNIMNLAVKTRLDQSTKVDKNANDKVKDLREIVDNAINGKHEYTSGHVARVSEYSVAVAKEMGYTDEKLQQLAISAQLHDIGKLWIEDGILASDKILTASERNEMSYHSVLGPEILKCLVRNDPALGKIVTKDVIEGVGQHHKTWDGYNFKDKDHPIEPNHDDINEFALIICVADCLDTMTSQRAYNSPKNVINAMRDLWGNRDKMFREDIAEKAIVVIGKQLAEIGYDMSEFFPDASQISNKKDLALKEFLEENKEEFKPKNPPQQYSSLGFGLDLKGHFSYENGPQYNEEKSMQGDIDFKKGKYVREENNNRAESGQKPLSEEEKEVLYAKAESDVREQYQSDADEISKAFERAKSKSKSHNPEQVLNATIKGKVITSEVKGATTMVLKEHEQPSRKVEDIEK